MNIYQTYALDLIDANTHACGAGKFLAALALDFFQEAPAPDFFTKRLRLRLRLLVFFFERLRFRLLRAKNKPALAPWQNILFPAN